MSTFEYQAHFLRRLDEVRRLCPEMRFGRFLATVAMLGEDETGCSLWDIEDEQLADAFE